MTDFPVWVGVLLWGGVVGVDLVSGPQALLSRPLVAGTVTGLLLGEPGLGLQLGVLMELFALDTLAVGAAWYPDLGTATVVAVAAAASWGGGPGAVGLAGAAGLALGHLGGWTMQWLRQANARSIRRHQGRLLRGDPVVLGRIQGAGLLRDLVRSLLLVGGGLALVSVAPMPPASLREDAVLRGVVLGGGLLTAARGLWRTSGRAPRWWWFAVGLGAGIAGLAVLA